MSKLQTEEQFAEWLWKSLGDFYRAPSGDKKRSELYSFMIINDTESPAEALATVYRRYVCEKATYRRAIGRALRRCAQEADAEVFQIADDLIYLLGYTGAVEALDGLLEAMFSESIAGEYPELLYACMANIQAIEPCDGLFDFVAKLVKSPYFDDGYIFSAIKIMVDCRPESSIEIVESLGKRISNLYNKVKRFGVGEESVYRETVAELFASNGEIMKKILFYSTEQKRSG